MLTLVILGIFGCVAGCSDNGDAAAADAGVSCVDNGTSVTILDNHRPAGGDHELEIPIADVVAGVAVDYDIRGDNVGHTHTVTVTAADFALLQDGTTVTITSSNNGSAGDSHTHDVVISCL
jgi:hypothetical protein